MFRGRESERNQRIGKARAGARRSVVVIPPPLVDRVSSFIVVVVVVIVCLFVVVVFRLGSDFHASSQARATKRAQGKRATRGKKAFPVKATASFDHSIRHMGTAWHTRGGSQVRPPPELFSATGRRWWLYSWKYDPNQTRMCIFLSPTRNDRPVAINDSATILELDILSSGEDNRSLRLRQR